MKKFILVLLVLFVGAIQAQSYLVVTDSLKQAVGESAVNDLNDVIYLGRVYDFPSIVGMDTLVAASGTLTDTILVERGTIRYNYFTNAKVDTIWTRVQVRDSANNFKSYISGSGANTPWIIWAIAPEMLRISIANAQIVDGRRWSYILEAYSKK